MLSVLKIAVTITSPLALLGFLGAIAFYAYSRRLKHLEINLESLPKSQRAKALSKYKNPGGIYGPDLDPVDWRDFLKVEMERRYKLARFYTLVFAICFILCFLASVVSILFANSNSPIQQTKKDDRPSEKDVLIRTCEKTLSHDADEEAYVLASHPPNSESRPTDKARGACTACLQDSPDDPLANGLYARALLADLQIEEAIARFLRAAKLGDIHSKIVLGLYYFHKKERDYDKGLAYLNDASGKGSIEATIRLGLIYELGEMGEPDYVNAIQCYTKGVKLESSEANFRLGQLYEFGLGVNQDVKKAQDFYRIAAGTGHEQAIQVLDEKSKEGTRQAL